MFNVTLTKLIFKCFAEGGGGSGVERGGEGNKTQFCNVFSM